MSRMTDDSSTAGDVVGPRMRRRDALALAGTAGVGAAFGFRHLFVPTSDAFAAACVLQREVTEGPYYLDLDLVRRDIRGNRKGTPLTLRFQVVDVATCRPISGAAVEIWHADASGQYSGVAGVSGNWLRGIQKTGSGGRVRFETIFPGWYRGRTPHIHMKVFVSGDEVHTGQVFFRPAVTRAVYGQGVYAQRGRQDTSNATDMIYRQAGSGALIALKRKAASVSGGYAGSMTIGVNR
jgi:protocatechuate 3,4-dioxygenase beta subunit